MAHMINLEILLGACADDSFDDGIRIDTELVPLAGPGGPVKPAVYEGGTYQQDRRWAAPDDAEPTLVIVIDNVPSQANRLEEAMRRNRGSARVPELVLDLSDLSELPAHLPRRLRAWSFRIATPMRIFETPSWVARTSSRPTSGERSSALLRRSAGH